MSNRSSSGPDADGASLMASGLVVAGIGRPPRHDGVYRPSTALRRLLKQGGTLTSTSARRRDSEHESAPGHAPR